MIFRVLFTSLIPSFAVSVIGIEALPLPVQCFQQDATLNPVQGGEAQMMLGMNGISLGFRLRMSALRLIPSNALMSVENTCMFSCWAALPMLRLPANSSKTFIFRHG